MLRELNSYKCKKWIYRYVIAGYCGRWRLRLKSWLYHDPRQHNNPGWVTTELLMSSYGSLYEVFPTWKNGRHSISAIYYFYFGSLVFHYNSWLFSTFYSSQGRLRTTQTPWASVLFGEKTLKARPRALASGPDNCFQFQPETKSRSINCPVLQMKKTRSWGLDPFAIFLCHRWYGKDQ